MGNICMKKYNHVKQDDDDNRIIRKKKRKLKEELINMNVIIHWPCSRLRIAKTLNFI
jgi:hypothetical protein